MILIVSLNFGVERIVRIGAQEAGPESPPAIVRGILEARHASAKGINAARALLRLQKPALVLGLTGGWPGRFIQENLHQEGIQFVPIEIQGENRTCVVLRESTGESRLVINECGPTVSSDELQRIDEIYQRHLAEAESVLLTGSLLPGIPGDFYARRIESAHRAGKQVLLDAAGEPLSSGILAKPFAVKINHHEASAWASHPISDPPSALEVANLIVNQGISIAMITLGGRGAVLCTPHEGYSYTVPAVERAKSVGAGDAALAGLALALLQRKSAKSAGHFACAVGTASTLHGAGRCDPKDVARFLEQINCIP